MTNNYFQINKSFSVKYSTLFLSEICVPLHKKECLKLYIEYQFKIKKKINYEGVFFSITITVYFC